MRLRRVSVGMSVEVGSVGLSPPLQLHMPGARFACQAVKVVGCVATKEHVTTERIKSCLCQPLLHAAPAPGMSPALRVARSPERSPLPMLQAGLEARPDSGCLPMHPNAPLPRGPGLSLRNWQNLCSTEVELRVTGRVHNRYALSITRLGQLSAEVDLLRCIPVGGAKLEVCRRWPT